MNQARRRAVSRAPRAAPVSLRGLVSMMLGLVLLAGLGYVGRSLQRPDSFPIRKVAVEGDFRYLAPAYVEHLVAAGLGGGFFQIDVQDLQQRLLAEPWIQEVAIERVWPETLRVAITEQRPVARWGRHGLLNAAAQVFRPAPETFPVDLVRLQGPAGTEKEVLRAYHEVAQVLQALDLTMARLSLSERGAWSVGLEDGSRLVLGRERRAERLFRFQRAFLAGLRERWPAVAAVDLRYTNGFAVMERIVEKAGETPVRKGG